MRGKRETSFPVNKLWLIYLQPSLWPFTIEENYKINEGFKCQIWPFKEKITRVIFMVEYACVKAVHFSTYLIPNFPDIQVSCKRNFHD